jgi:thioester reductase-like protein
VVRAKRDGSGHLDIKERVRKIRGEAIFTDFLELWDKVVEVIETTDLGIKDCGISAGTIDRLIKFGVEQIVHSAADVDFLAPLDRIAISNISSTLELQSLARRFGCCRFVYVSTVFVNPKCGSASEPNKEELFTLGKYDPVEIYHSMVGDQWLAEKVKKEYGFQNNYVLTKCIAEHLLARDTSMRLSIIRPGIVGPAWMRPYTGKKEYRATRCIPPPRCPLSSFVVVLYQAGTETSLQLPQLFSSIYALVCSKPIIRQVVMQGYQ